MTSKQRSYLKGLAMTEDSILQIGKGGVSPENVKSVAEALEARELVKITILKNCMEDCNEAATKLAERTNSQLVQVIGRKVVLYKPNTKNPQIVLPK